MESKFLDTLLQIVQSHVRCSGGIALESNRRRVVALAGPTGVGKTTTIAKLAAGFHITEGRRVGLITIDTFRVGAVDQIRTYAEVIGLPMRSASSQAELVQALDEFADCELVLIDTAGRSPRDELRIQELRDLLSDAAIDDVHLVLSLSSSHRSLKAMAERFRVLRPTHLLLTKLDEAAGLGAIYSAARSIDLPLSYFTTGQGVPDDIERAAPGRTARMILGMEDLVHPRDRGWSPRNLPERSPPARHVPDS
jgi:flagellar biosynthesis protein FlhF